MRWIINVDKGSEIIIDVNRAPDVSKVNRQLFPYFSDSFSPASAVISWKSATKGDDT